MCPWRRTNQDQDKPPSVVAHTGGVFNTQNPEHVANGLPSCRHDNDLAIAFAVNGRLCNMGTGSDTEQDREEVGGCWTRTSV